MTKLVYRVRVEAHTPNGPFVGYIGREGLTKEDAEEIKDNIKVNINGVEWLSFDSEDGEVLMNKHMIDNSVFITKIVTKIAIGS